MNKIIDFAVERSRSTLLLLLFILVAGYVTYNSIPKESMPDVKIPIIYVSVAIDGISPEDSERLLVRPIEKRVAGIRGLKELRSTAAEGYASVVLEFVAGFNAQRALSDVRVKIDEARSEMPNLRREPIVNEISIAEFPVLNVILTGNVSERRLTAAAKYLSEKIASLPGILESKISGARDEAVNIIVDPFILENYSLNLYETINDFRANNVVVASGGVDNESGKISVKLPGLIENYTDLFNMPIKSEGESVVKLRDIAEIKRGFKDVESHARVNGKRAIGIAISKRIGANVIDVVSAVKNLVATEKARLPSDINIIYSQDDSNKIRTMLSDLQNNVILAVLVVVLILLLLMNQQTALLVGLSIPGAFLFGILAIGLFGLTLNIVVLFSLILSVGLLVDSAVVVGEYANSKIANGVRPKQAYIQSAKYMSWPIISSTATTLAVFIPLLFWPGTTGQILRYLPMTLIFTLIGSLLMALIFLPVVATNFKIFNSRRNVNSNNHNDNNHDNINQQKIDLFSRLSIQYVKILKKILHRPSVFASSILISVALIFVMFFMFGSGFTFFPKVEPDNANIYIKSGGNLSIDQKDKIIREAEERIADMDNEIRVIYARSGSLSGKETPTGTIGILQLEFAFWRNRRKAEDILQEIKDRLHGIKSIEIEIRKQRRGPSTGKEIDIALISQDSEKLKLETERLAGMMREVGGFRNIETSLSSPEIEWEIEVNRELAGRFGVNLQNLGNMVKLATNGIIIGDYRPDDSNEKIDFILRFPENYRNISEIENIKINTPQGSVPISSFITKKPIKKTDFISRIDQSRVHRISADMQFGEIADNKLKELTTLLQKRKLTSGVEIKFRGDDEKSRETSNFLKSAFIISLFSMFVILVTQFNNIYYSLVIMSSVFLSTGGVLLGLLIGNQSFGIVMCGFGVIALSGIVVNNNIILIDEFTKLRSQGLAFQDSLIASCKTRLRPILLTAGTTVLGLLPMAFQMNVDFVNRDLYFNSPSSQWWVQISTSIVGGLSFATILTLFFTPSLLQLWHNFQTKRVIS